MIEGYCPICDTTLNFENHSRYISTVRCKECNAAVKASRQYQKKSLTPCYSIEALLQLVGVGIERDKT